MSPFGLQMTALTLAISLDRIFDGFGRPFFGWVSDNIGREKHHVHRLQHRGRRMIVLLNFGASTRTSYPGDRGLFSACSARSTRCSRQTAANTFGSKFAASNAGFSTPPRALRRSSCRSRALLSGGGGWSAVFALINRPQHRGGLARHVRPEPLRRRYLSEEPAPARRWRRKVQAARLA